MSEAIIELRGIRKAYAGGPQVLRGVDLTVAEGEFVALMGRSGCGKTTLLNVIGGLDADFEGEARVTGGQLETMTDAQLSAFRNREVGFIFQAFHLLEHLTCVENVTLPDLFAPEGGVGREARRERAKALLRRMGLEGVEDRLPGALSGGERQRVAIARALFRRPRLLIADEPTGNLDARTGDEILTVFRELNSKEGLTLVVVTHDRVVADMADRVVTLEEGHIVGDAAA